MPTTKLYSVGYNAYGEFGLGHSKPVTELTLLPNQSITKVFACQDYSIYTDNTYSKLWSSGLNGLGQLGLGRNHDFEDEIHKYQPKYAFLYDLDNLSKINTTIGKTKLLNLNELQSYLRSSKSNFSLLAISGYKSLYFLDSIVTNTNNLGIASKEAIVSAGHIFKKKKYFSKFFFT